MAEYRALSQNTYKFVVTTETVFQTVGDIANPVAPQFGRIKMLENSRGVIQYYDLRPSGAGLATTNKGKITSTLKGTTEASSKSHAVGVLYGSGNLAVSNTAASCVVDGKKYYGYKNCIYSTSWVDTCGLGANTTGTLPARYAPAFKAKVLKYDSTLCAIVPVEYNITATDISAYTFSGAYGEYGCGGQCVGIYTPKTSADIILGIEIEYPKYDITIHGLGLQYSIDDGATFHDVTDGLVLEQVEHVVFKNTGNSTRLIGTTEAGSDVATIVAGATYVAVPTASGTWYIS